MAGSSSQAEVAPLGARDILRYSLLPSVLPRFRDLFMTGFAFFAFFMAQVYAAVRLIPPYHPYLNPANVGRYGIRNVVAEAANHLVMRRENIDQIVMFFALIAGMIILALQFFGFLFAAVAVAPAMAGGFDWGALAGLFGGSLITGADWGGLFSLGGGYFDMFTTEKPEQDIAFILLDRVFGIPAPGMFGLGGSFFGSCVGDPGTCLSTDPSNLEFGDPLPDIGAFPWPFHEAMHELFGFYSMALLVVASMILIYFVITVTAETAQTGTPFGKRFNSVWAPIRVVAAFGLLIPLGSTGLNSAQYITLYAAKYGSGLATNGWILFNQDLTTSYIGDAQNMVARPNAPDIAPVLEFFMLARACEIMEEEGHRAADDSKREIKPYLVRAPWLPDNELVFTDASKYEFDAGGTNFTGTSSGDSTTYSDALTFFNNNDIVIRIGEQDDERYTSERGHVYPYCGELVLPVTDVHQAGASYVREHYYDLLKEIWNDADIIDAAEKFVIVNHSVVPKDAGVSEPTPQLQVDLLTKYLDKIDQIIYDGVKAQVTDMETYGAIPSQLGERGWAGAGIWYNRIAEMNGAIISAVADIAHPSLYPSVMERVLTERRKHDKDITPIDQFDPNMSKGTAITFGRPGEEVDANVYWRIYKYWRADGALPSEQRATTGNIFIDVVNFIFGTQGLFDLRSEKNRDVHPLAQLVGVGKSLIETTIRNVFIGGASGVASILTPGYLGAALGVASSVMFSVAGMTLTAGFVLFYIIPFLPFLYFFFAVGGWIKTVFEAMVGVPLWALAHIRIDGNGLPGDAAMSGYYLIFEIFLRPILIVFGLLAGVTIFAAQAKVLHDIFPLVTSNLTGFDHETVDADLLSQARGPIDELFFTILYAIIMYMMALSSFKLVDLIPQQIMRWMGAGVSAFHDQRDDIGSTMVQYGAIGGSQVFGSVMNAAGGAISGTRNTVQGLMSAKTPSAPPAGK